MACTTAREAARDGAAATAKVAARPVVATVATAARSARRTTRGRWRAARCRGTNGMGPMATLSRTRRSEARGATSSLPPQPSCSPRPPTNGRSSCRRPSRLVASL
eukprot:6240552-Prymnesium_polylepis.1